MHIYSSGAKFNLAYAFNWKSLLKHIKLTTYQKKYLNSLKSDRRKYLYLIYLKGQIKSSPTEKAK